MLLNIITCFALALLDSIAGLWVVRFITRKED
jgi:hypothetical protein